MTFHTHSLGKILPMLAPIYYMQKFPGDSTFHKLDIYYNYFLLKEMI